MPVWGQGGCSRGVGRLPPSLNKENWIMDPSQLGCGPCASPPLLPASVSPSVRPTSMALTEDQPPEDGLLPHLFTDSSWSSPHVPSGPRHRSGLPGPLSLLLLLGNVLLWLSRSHSQLWEGPWIQGPIVGALVSSSQLVTGPRALTAAQAGTGLTVVDSARELQGLQELDHRLLPAQVPLTLFNLSSHARLWWVINLFDKCFIIGLRLFCC